ncbi:DUF805 domain-containing protein [Pseudooceanicola sp. C21-150M6]|uniref:DUF805 domain-containing protein n=1 Tax=Pseudooceanicola sp. C21-150M6 TaxID=3434355 RepID=UPI003D7F4840
MSFADAIRSCLQKYVTFSGRASRPEYWWFVLFLIAGGIATSILDSILFGTGTVETGPGAISAKSENGPISGLFSLATLLPILAAGWRRMHDTGRSGLYLLYPLIVIVGMGTFASMAGATSAVMSGDFGAAFAGLTGIVMLLSMLVFIISPLIVIWWLTRPSQPGPNTYGPNPHEVLA